MLARRQVWGIKGWERVLPVQDPFICRSRRITMVLDLKAAYRRLRDGQSWVFRTLTADWDAGLHGRLAA